MKIKSFRGKLAGDDIGSQQKIRLGTNNGLTGYKIRKFQTIQESPGTTTCEGVVMLWTVKPDVPNSAGTALATYGKPNFNSPTLLGVSFYSSSSSANAYPEDMTVIFDQVKFNQDIYISYFDVSTSNDDMNYYLELDQVKLDLNEATVATLKDMRGTQ